MMLGFRMTSTVLLLLLLCGPALAATSGDVARLVQLSGVADQIALIPGQIESDVSTQLAALPGVPASIGQIIEQATDESLVPERIVRGLSDTLIASLADADVEPLLAWYQSDLGRRITAAEIDASSAEATERIAATMDSLLADAPRVERARAIIERINATEEALRTAETIQKAILSVVLELLPAEAGIDEHAMRETVRGSIEAMRPELERYLLASSVYTYRDLSDAELEAYEQFLGRPGTRRFYQQTMEGLTAEWERAFADMARRMIEGIAAIAASTPA